MTSSFDERLAKLVKKREAFSKLARIVRDDDPLQPDERICLHKVLAEENEYISQVTNWVAWWLAELDEQQKLDALCSNEFVTEVQTLVINSYEINPTVPPMALRLQSKLESTYIDGEKLYMGYLCAAQFLAAIWGLARMKQFGDCFDDLIVDSYGLFVASCTFSSRAELSDLDIPPIDAISIQSRGGQAKAAKYRKLREKAIELFHEGKFPSKRQAAKKIIGPLNEYAVEIDCPKLSQDTGLKTIQKYLKGQ